MHFLTYSDRPLDDCTDLSIRRQPRMMNESCRHFGVPLENICDPTVPYDWTGRAFRPQIVRYVESLIDDDIVLFTDAWDSFFAGTPAEIEAAFVAFDKPLVFSTEVNLWPPASGHLMSHPPAPTRFQYACSGGWAGRVWAVREMMTSHDYWPPECICSQDAFNLWFCQHQDSVALDYWCRLFLCIYDDNKHGTPPCHAFSIKDGRLYNEETDSYTLVIHGGGGFGMEALALWDKLKRSRG